MFIPAGFWAKLGKAIAHIGSNLLNIFTVKPILKHDEIPLR